MWGCQGMIQGDVGCQGVMRGVSGGDAGCCGVPWGDAGCHGVPPVLSPPCEGAGSRRVFWASGATAAAWHRAFLGHPGVSPWRGPRVPGLPTLCMLHSNISYPSMQIKSFITALDGFN